MIGPDKDASNNCNYGHPATAKRSGKNRTIDKEMRKHQCFNEIGFSVTMLLNAVSRAHKKFRSTKSEIERSSNDQIDEIPNKLLSDSVIAVAGEMSWGGVRAFGLHIQRSNSNCCLFGAASKLAAHCLIGEMNPDQPISRQCAALLRIWRRKSYEPYNAENLRHQPVAARGQKSFRKLFCIRFMPS